MPGIQYYFTVSRDLQYSTTKISLSPLKINVGHMWGTTLTDLKTSIICKGNVCTLCTYSPRSLYTQGNQITPCCPIRKEIRTLNTAGTQNQQTLLRQEERTAMSQLPSLLSPLSPQANPLDLYVLSVLCIPMALEGQ